MFASAAGLGADPTVLVHARMLLALGIAFCTCRPACLECSFDTGEILPRAAAEEIAGGGTEIGAVEVEADAAA